MVRLGVRGWELYRGPACVEGCEPLSGLRDRFWARLWLQQLKSEPSALYNIRDILAESNTLWPLHKATIDQAIDCMANLFSDGEWHVHAPALPDNGGAGGSNSAPSENENLAEMLSALPTFNDRPEPPPPPQEEGALPRNADQEAIAAAMKLAAQLGIPFCEECARAALKRAHEAAYA